MSEPKYTAITEELAYDAGHDDCEKELKPKITTLTAQLQEAREENEIRLKITNKTLKRERNLLKEIEALKAQNKKLAECLKKVRNWRTDDMIPTSPVFAELDELLKEVE